MMRWLLILAFLTAGPAAKAATLSLGKQSGFPVIVISGDLKLGDDQIFRKQISGLNNAFVYLQSYGGSVAAGLSIGQIISDSHFATVVPSDTTCTSICAAIWLGGAKRYAGRNATVGFHSAFVPTHGVKRPSAYANLMMSRYYRRIGISKSAIRHLMKADPDEWTWLSQDVATRYDIDYLLAPTARLPEAVKVVPANKSSFAAPAFSDDTLSEAARLAKNFDSRFSEAGLAGLHKSIEACGAVVLENKTRKSAIYCSALNDLVMKAELQQADLDRTSVSSDSIREEVKRRIDVLADTVDMNAGELLDQGRIVSFVAANMIDTTREPAKEIITENEYQVVESKSTNTCSQIARKMDPFELGVSDFVGKLFCDGGKTSPTEAAEARRARMAARRARERVEFNQAVDRYDDSVSMPIGVGVGSRRCVQPTTPWDAPCK